MPITDANLIRAEEAEFPVLCETCLGPNPYVRMTRQKEGQECKVCTRGFTVFKWSPGAGMRLKKTEVCQTCAKMKNVCQTCLLDLQYGLSTQFRDAAFGKKADTDPKDNLNKAYVAQNAEGHLDNVTASSFGKSDPAVKEMLKKLARQDPNYNKSRPKPCSQFAKGTCTRGDACPFVHEVAPQQPQPGPSMMSQPIIQNRYFGVNDPAAQKLSSRASTLTNNLTPPADESITSLFISQLPEGASEEQVKAVVPEDQRASVKSVTLMATTKCGFVNFDSRAAAEAVALAWSGTGVQLEGAERQSKVQWGRSKAKPAAAA